MTIAIWGDSITFGKGDPEGLGWVGRLTNAYPAGSEVRVHNLGVRGDTTVDLLKRLPEEAARIKPDMAILAIGINDTRYKESPEAPEVGIEIFKANIVTLIEEIQKVTPRIFIIGLTKVDDARPASDSGSRYTNALIDTYDQALMDIAREERVGYMHIYNSLDPATELADGLHPNAAGYQKLFEELSPRILVNSQ